MLVEVERFKMVVVCRPAGTVVCLEYFQRDLIIQKCCVDSFPVVLRRQIVGYMSLYSLKQTSIVWKAQAAGHPPQ